MLKRYLIKGLAAVLLFLLLVGIRVFFFERSHFAKAEQYYSKEDWKLAIREYDLTMHMYIPGSPYVGKSAERLWQIGEMFEKEDKPDWALIAYSSIRSSFFASRSLYTPGKDWIVKCDDKISDLNVKLLIRDGSIKPSEADIEKKKFLYVMKVDRAPAPLWTVAAEAGFFGWIASVLFIIIKGFDDNGKPKWRSALYGLLLFSATFAVWVISLLKA